MTTRPGLQPKLEADGRNPDPGSLLASPGSVCLSLRPQLLPTTWLESCLAPNTDLLNKGFHQGPPE